MNKYFLDFLLIFIIFFPLKNFHLFFFLLSTILILFIIILKKKSININILFLFSLFLMYLLGGNLYRFVFLNVNDLRDFFEIFRFIPLLLLVFFRKEFSYFDFNKLIRYLKIYVVIDFIVSYVQFYHFDYGLFKQITDFYSYPHHIRVSYELSNRTLGLSTGPGDHGAFILFCYTIILYDMIFISKKLMKNFIFLIFATFSLFTSQSRISILTFFVLHLLVIFLMFREWKRFKFKLIKYLLLIIPIFVIFISMIDQIRYFYSFLEYGTELSSFQKREIKWAEILNLSTEYPLLYLIGFGKSLLENYTTAMDSDILYILIVYGMPIFLVFTALSVYFTFCFFKSDNYNRLLSLLFLIGLPISYTSTYFIYPKIIFILFFLYLFLYTKRKWRK